MPPKDALSDPLTDDASSFFGLIRDPERSSESQLPTTPSRQTRDNPTCSVSLPAYSKNFT